MALNKKELTVITNYVKKQIKIHKERYDKLEKIFYSNNISLEKRIENGMDFMKESGYLCALRDCLNMIECSIDCKKFFEKIKRGENANSINRKVKGKKV